MNMGWMGLLGGLGQGMQMVGMSIMQHAQKAEDSQREQEIWKQRERFLENLKAPAEKVETVDDPDNAGHKIAITKQWVPPKDDNTPGRYQEVGRVHVPVKWEMKKVGVGNDMEQDVFMDPDNPENIKPIPGTTPQPRHDPEGQKRTALEAGRLGMEGDRLKLDRLKFIQEGMDKQNKDNPQHERYSYHEEEDPKNPNKKLGYAFDKFSGTRKRVMDGPQSPGGGMVSDMAASKPDPGDFNPNASGPLSQLAPTGGAGSGGSMSPRPAAAAQPSTGKPSAQEFLTAAKARNPGKSDAELLAYYQKTYGGQ